jgi:hypothetical protein
MTIPSDPGPPDAHRVVAERSSACAGAADARARDHRGH